MRWRRRTPRAPLRGPGGADRWPTAPSASAPPASAKSRDALFASVQQRAVRLLALRTFRHLHAVACASIWTGRPAACRASSTAARTGIQSVLRLAVFNVVPTVMELVMVTAIIWRMFDWRFAAVTCVAVLALCRLHRRPRRPPRPLPPDDERHRQRRVDQVAGQPAELRDGEVFRQRGA